MPDAEASRGAALGSSSQPLVAAYDTAILDLDGVVYIGGRPVGDAPRLLTEVAAAGMRLAYVTNNASRTPVAVMERLRGMGVPVSVDDVVTSAQAVARMVAGEVPRGSRVLVVGGAGLIESLAEHGLVAVASLADEPAAVVQGFHPDVGWRQLAEGAAAVGQGLPWFASNLDRTLPTSRGPAPGNGALVETIAIATGRRPTVAGKPEPALFEETLLRVGGERPLVVGDRLDTDIEGAVRAEIDSLLVMTGVSDVVTVAQAPRGLRPTYLASDLRGLFAEHPAVQDDRGIWRCGGWRVETHAGAPALLGGGDSADALRALVSWCWARADTSGVEISADQIVSAWRTAGLPELPANVGESDAHLS